MEKIPTRWTRGGGAHSVTIGNVPSLVWFQAIANGKSRITQYMRCRVLVRSISTRHVSSAAAFCLLALVLGGCAGAGYGEVPVSGQVTYNGEPLPNVHLSFQPIAKDENGFGPGSFGRTDQQGRFELRTVWPDALGAIPGEHRVTISYENLSQQPPDVVIPREFVEGTATFEVPTGGTDEAVIKLTSTK